MRGGDGPPQPHVDACILDVESGRLVVFTTTLQSGWRPAPESPIMTTAILTYDDRPEGTANAAWVMHCDSVAPQAHASMGFADGWGSVTEQLAALAEAMA